MVTMIFRSLLEGRLKRTPDTCSLCCYIVLHGRLCASAYVFPCSRTVGQDLGCLVGGQTGGRWIATPSPYFTFSNTSKNVFLFFSLLFSTLFSLLQFICHLAGGKAFGVPLDAGYSSHSQDFVSYYVSSQHTLNYGHLQYPRPTRFATVQIVFAW